MPLFETITIDSAAKLYVWEITESLEELCESVRLSENQQNQFNSITNEKYKLSFLSVRKLVGELGYMFDDLYYDENGKPFLKDNRKISISHSFNMVVVLICDDVEVGVDIEKKRDKIIRVSQKFTNWNYRNTTLSKESVLQKLTMIWSAKEAAFKAHGTPGITANHIFVKDFFPNDTETNVKISHNEQNTFYNISFMDHEDFVIAYCLPKK